jgi:phosphoadenosine phosphosulfate reductase
MRFGWCTDCNIPIVDVRYECGLCGSKPFPVSVTPPGDVRPAFPRDLELLRKVANEQFGNGCSESLFPDGKIAVLNKAPGLDRMDEVVIDGQVLCTLKFDLVHGYRLLMRMEGARRISGLMHKGWIMVDNDAAPYIIKGASVMVPGISDADTVIEKGDEVVVLNKERMAISTGFARMSGRDMTALEKGAATKTRSSSEPRPPVILEGKRTWKDAVDGNADTMNRSVDKAKRFINKVTKQHDLPIAVSFSGGKDSLATLLLVQDAGLVPKILFVDTGLEFEETVDYVHGISEKLALELLAESAGDAFWENLPAFGPPAKDFRWCCKSCKLGPATRLIRKHFPDGVLSFIGQRRYESKTREMKGKVWRNPWVPGQVGASPIQDWTALHVWLYIFMKDAEYNPWYERGLERIGCFMCPATDLAELKIIREGYMDYSTWDDYLSSYAREKGYDDPWTSLGLWRWKSPPSELKGFVRKTVTEKERFGDVRLDFVEGYTPCAEGVSVEGVFNAPQEIERIGNLLNIVGAVGFEDDIKACKCDGMTVFEEGAVVVKGKDKEALKKKRENLERIARKAVLCSGCGICTGLCKEGAIRLENGKAWIDPEACIHCMKCLSPCPAADLRDEFRF